MQNALSHGDEHDAEDHDDDHDADHDADLDDHDDYHDHDRVGCIFDTRERSFTCAKKLKIFGKMFHMCQIFRHQWKLIFSDTAVNRRYLHCSDKKNLTFVVQMKCARNSFISPYFSHIYMF